MTAAPPSVLEQWKGELEDRFGLVFEVLDRAYVSRMRREHERRLLWCRRLDRFERDLEHEPARVREFYEVRARRVEPVGLVYLWPETN